LAISTPLVRFDDRQPVVVDEDALEAEDREMEFGAVMADAAAPHGPGANAPTRKVE
jgi:hypothetical protein